MPKILSPKIVPKSRQEIEDSIPSLPKGFGIIGCDQSYGCTGLVYADRTGVVFETVIPRKTLGIGRLLELESRIVGFLKLHHTSVFCLEGYSRGSENRREEAGEVASCIKLLMYRMQIPTYVIAPTSVKLFMTGKGNAKKDMMVEASFLTPQLLAEKRSKQVREAVSDALGVCLSGLSIITDPTSEVAFTKVV